MDILLKKMIKLVIDNIQNVEFNKNIRKINYVGEEICCVVY